MKFKYGDSTADKVEAIIGRQLSDAEYEAVKLAIEQAAENYGKEIQEETVATIQSDFNSSLRRIPA